MPIRKRNEASLGDAISAWLEGAGLDVRAAAHKILQDWPNVVGPAVAAQAQPLEIRGGVLYLRVPAPAWKQELNLRSPEIVAAVNRAAGREICSAVRIV